MDQLERVRTFLQRRATNATIKVSDDFLTFTGDARVGGLETCNFQFPIAELERVVKLMQGCLTLTDLTFHYGANDVGEILGLLHMFRVLDLTVNGHEDAIAALLTANPTLEACTLRVHPSETVLRKILTPLMFHRVEEKSRALLKKLVLVNAAEQPQETSIENVLAQVIEHNTLLEHLEVGDDVFRVVAADSVNVFNRASLKAKAIRKSTSLKELRLQCTIAEFKEIVAVGGLVTPSERTRNTTLSTLRVSLRDFVSLPDTARGRVVECYDWLADLAKLVESTRTLEHVEVSQDSAFKLLERDPKSAAALKTRLRDELQQLCNARARTRPSVVSTSSTSASPTRSTERELRSVSVGWWKAVLKGDKWEITYTGPGEN